jgi:hypothetical protein
VAVEVVGREVEQHADVRGEGLRVLGLEARHLADHRRARRDLADQRRGRRADVSRDGDRQLGGAPDRAQQLDRRRLAVGSGDGHEAVSQQAPGQLQLAQDGQVALAGRGDHGRLVGHTRALDHAGRALEQRQAVAFELGGDVVGQLRSAAVDRKDVAVLAQHACRGDARASEADDQVRPVWKWRPQVIDCW